MSGLFQRIARRDAERPDEPSTMAPADQGDAPTQQFEAPDGMGEPDAPTTAQPAVVEAPASESDPAAEPGAAEQAKTAAVPHRPGFRERGRMRRRLRYLRKLRELQLRDLGGLLFDLKRFGRQREDLVALKLDQVRACDDELRTLETALDERREVRDIREAGIGGTCPRCSSIYGSTDRFCAHCGAALGGAVQGPAPAPDPVAAAPQPPAPAPTSAGPQLAAPEPAPVAAQPPPEPPAPEPGPPAETGDSAP